jgi:flagellar basal body P-ring protein FlgI
MKNFFVSFVTFFAVHSAALACPNLSGTYVGAKGSQLKIVHEGDHLKINNGPGLIVDSAEHELVAGKGANVYYTATCVSEEQLTIKIRAIQAGEQIFSGTDTFTVTETGLHVSSTGVEDVEEEDWIREADYSADWEIQI